ncbi:MAG: hypothetical protein JHD16_04745 [Solirubrobacteraceae bacterium]|nr:hypothetical protein [Solirubrobacteraceae bacterium]
MRRTFLPVATSVLVLSAVVAGCGDDASGPDPVEKVSIADQKVTVERELLAPEDFEATKAGSAERAFLEFWAAVQAGDRRQVLTSYDPGLVDVVGAAEIADVARRVSAVYRTGKPTITSVSADGGVTTIRYVAPAQVTAGAVAPNSIAYRRTGGAWNIVFSSALDDELRLTAQTVVQNSIDPTGKKVAPKAVAAGDVAARKQTAFVAEELAGTTP